MRLSQEIKLMAAALPCPCPSRYSSQNVESDKRRIAWLWRKRRARRKLSPVEDAELAHVNARYMAFVSGPEMQSRAWLVELKEKERKFLVAFGPPLTYREQALLICLSTLYPQNSEIGDPDIAAQFSVFSMVDRIHGLGGFHRLLVIPLLLAQFRRSEHGAWVLYGFLASAVTLLFVCWALVLAQVQSWPNHLHAYGVLVKDDIAQSTVFWVFVELSGRV